MSEVVIDDDLEEGEITDDILPEPNYSKAKEKKLPRRYILHENKNINSKHKRNCRHAGHHHRKKIRTKSTPVVHKKHCKYTCPHRGLNRHKHIDEHLGYIKSGYPSELDHKDKQCSHSSSSSVASAFKNFASPPRTFVKVVRHNDNNHKPLKNNATFKPRVKEEFIEKIDTFGDINLQSEQFSQKPKIELSQEEEKNVMVKHQNVNGSNLNEMNKANGEVSEDEDEEELRRIALSTCLLRPSTEESIANKTWPTSGNFNQNIDILEQTALNQISNRIQVDHEPQSIANYEVVDMEVEDNESSTENINAEELFVIDTMPVVSSGSLIANSGEFDWNSNPNLPCDGAYNVSLKKNQSLPSSQCVSNEDFEEELLRAEIIASMNLNKKRLQNGEKKFNPALKIKNQSQIQSPFVKKMSFFKKTKSLPMYSKRPVSNFISLSHKRGVNKTKLNYVKVGNHKVSTPSQRKVDKGPERIVITLNNDSSTEESDQEELNRSKATQENEAMASIEALISDARQKSDIHKGISNDSNTVSCLSKAQQEEYNSLKKILAEKQVLSIPSITTHEEKTLNHPDLNVLIKKISVAKENLEKEMKILNDAEKELQIKKQLYMTSKLKVQHLKEQLHAAELTRASNLESWKKSAAKLDILKKSVSKHEALMNSLTKRLNDQSLLIQNFILSPISGNNMLMT